jgi:putative DNA-invertase from lambdoid prophage Rac
MSGSNPDRQPNLSHCAKKGRVVALRKTLYFACSVDRKLSGQKRPFVAQFRMASRPTDPSVKAALYARVSTDDGRQTVGNQVRQLRELALAREFDIYREYTDEETGASANRTSFLALLRDARLRRFRVLLITDLDRLTREGAAAGFAHLAELDRYGVRVVSLGQGWLDYDPRIDEDPELREMRNIQTAVALTWAALERQKISRRTKAGLERARGEGKRLGRKPVDATGEQVCHLLAKGISISQVAIKLHISRRTAYRLRNRLNVSDP